MLGFAFLAGVLAMGCRTTPCSEANFRGTFDAQKVVSLAQESHIVAWRARYWAREDLKYAGFSPNRLDRETVFYLDGLSKQVSWIARDVENNPATPRCASKKSYDNVAFKTTMLRKRYQPTSFRPATNKQIEHLFQMLDEIASYYQVKTQ
jgi:hypothetical protein